MIRPKVPTNPTPTGYATPPVVVEPATVIPGSPVSQPTPAVPVSSRPAVQLTPGSVIALAGAGTAVVLVVGAVLVSMLLAVAITGASVAVCAVVIRSILASDNRR
ncbi:SpdD-like protein [Streptomyces sp. NPDC003011]